MQTKEQGHNWGFKQGPSGVEVEERLKDLGLMGITLNFFLLRGSFYM